MKKAAESAAANEILCKKKNQRKEHTEFLFATDLALRTVVSFRLVRASHVPEKLRDGSMNRGFHRNAAATRLWQSFMQLLQADIHFELHEPCQSQ